MRQPIAHHHHHQVQERQRVRRLHVQGVGQIGQLEARHGRLHIQSGECGQAAAHVRVPQVVQCHLLQQRERAVVRRRHHDRQRLQSEQEQLLELGRLLLVRQVQVRHERGAELSRRRLQVPNGRDRDVRDELLGRVLFVVFFFVIEINASKSFN